MSYATTRSFPRAGKLFLLFSLVLIVVVFSASTPPTISMPPVNLPLEVLGDDGYTVSVDVNVSDASGVDRMYLKIHRPTYRDVSTTSRGPKASYRINDGAWIGISNATAQAFPHEAAFGGINGTYHTIRMHVQADGVVSGSNTIEFRFNKTDGLTNGFRVLEMNLVRGNENVLPPEAFTYEDPTTWDVPSPSSADAQAGKTLWENAQLQESPLSSRILPIKCGDCHARDGRDLKYFNYSDWSIQERSKFHGLSDQEGRQIAAYIRSVDAPAPAQARPWNPPYQPGPGIDDLPVEEWAAGAGLEWVLEDQAEEADYAFNSLSADDLRAVIDVNGHLNVRELPEAFQFPDWNGWLPHEHPGDIMPNSFYNNANVHIGTSPNSSSYQEVYETIFNKAAESPQQLTGFRGLGYLLERFATHASHFHGENSFSNAQENGVDSERKLQAIGHWSAVKQWEIMHTHNLEDKAPVVWGAEGGEARSWLSTRRNIFELAPHRAAKNIENFEFQNRLEGKFFSNAWYQAQLILNSGNKGGGTLAPNDWNYLPNHIGGLKGAGGPSHPWRWILAFTKMLQHFNDGKPIQGNNNSGIGFRQLHPARYLFNSLFDELDPAVAITVKEQLLHATMDLLEARDNSEWPRTSTPVFDNELRPSSYTPQVMSDQSPLYIGARLHEHDYENVWMTMIPIFQEQGLGCQALQRAVDWGKSNWPSGNWDGLLNTDDCNDITACFTDSGLVGEPGLMVSVDAACSKLGNLTNPIYSWDFGDGTTASGATAQHSYPNSGTYTIRLTLEVAGGERDEVTKQVSVFSMDGAGVGLRGEYFTGRNFDVSFVERIDPTVDFNWDTGTAMTGMPDDNFSVRWTGWVVPLFTDTYTFETETDDGARLWVNGQQLVNQWIPQGPTKHEGSIQLTAGERYPITFEFYEGGGGAMARLRWKSDDQVYEIIPARQLFPDAGNSSPLPVDYEYFTAAARGKQAMLNWATESELDSRGFHVQHASGTGLDFVSIGFVESSTIDGASYEFRHNDPANGTNYYRLEQEDLDGTRSFSEVRQLNFSDFEDPIRVLPNPASTIVQLRGFDPEVSLVTRLFDLNGRLLSRTTDVSLIPVHDVPLGTYILEIVNGDQLTRRKIVIAR